MSFELQRTIAINNTIELEKRVGKETLVVCGSPRGMTSVVAFSLYELGLFLGHHLGAKNYEDQDFLQAIPPKAYLKQNLTNRSDFNNLICSRNEKFQRWGFKLPRASEHVESLIDALRNPVFVVCVRNPMAVARSVSNREPHFNGDLTKLFNIGTSYFQAIDVLLADNSVPSIFIDMDMVQRQPGVFLQEISAALKLKGNLKEIRDQISRQGYQESKPRDGIVFKKQ